MTRFSTFSDKELDAMEEAFCIAGLLLLDEEIRREKNNRIENNAEEVRGKE